MVSLPFAFMTPMVHIQGSTILVLLLLLPAVYTQIMYLSNSGDDVDCDSTLGASSSQPCATIDKVCCSDSFDTWVTTPVPDLHTNPKTFSICLYRYNIDTHTQIFSLLASQGRTDAFIQLQSDFGLTAPLVFSNSNPLTSFRMEAPNAGTPYGVSCPSCGTAALFRVATDSVSIFRGNAIPKLSSHLRVFTLKQATASSNCIPPADD